MASAKQPSTVKRIETALMEQISVGDLTPGMRLDESGLAERFGVSRTPIREVLNRLIAQGILVTGERRGAFVAQYSREELAQIFEAMHEIESVCARVASQRLDLLARSEIEAAQSECIAAAQQGDRAAYLRANEAFHLAIYKATGNPYLAEIASEFRRRTGPFRAKKFANPEDLIQSADSHQSLIDNIFSEDSAVASDGMRSHMTASFVQTLRAN